MNVLDDRLLHSNSAVVMATVKLFLHLTLAMPPTHQQVAPPLSGFRVWGLSPCLPRTSRSRLPAPLPVPQDAASPAALCAAAIQQGCCSALLDPGWLQGQGALVAAVEASPRDR